MSSEIAISVSNVGKRYELYDQPRDRLRQFVYPKVSKLVGRPARDYFREFWALRNIEFTVQKGDSVGILGRNGSGKSTLLQLITGTLAPTSGTITTNGRISALLELGSGFNPDFSGRDNVYLNAALQGFSDEQIDAKFDEIAAFADIGRFLEQPVKTYSSGMYARLAFSAAIHNEPDILIVDEILAVGDTPFQQKCLKKLYAMLDRGVSVLMVSHDAYQIRSICKNALLLKNGNQVAFDRADKAMDQYLASFVEEKIQLDPIPEASHRERSMVPAPTNAEISTFSILIKDPVLTSNGITTVQEIKSGANVEIKFNYEILGDFQERLSFVVNLYREDDVYIFGTTTIMQGLDPFDSDRTGVIKIAFPSLPLLSGQYKWRVAINDDRGMGIMAEATPICSFKVTDDFTAVGIIDIPHTWIVERVKA